MRSTGSLALLASTIGAYATSITLRQAAPRDMVILNNCPGTINVFQGQQFEGSLATGANITRPGTGLWSTDANGGGLTTGISRAGAFDAGFYYIVRDGEKPLNAGINIKPLETFGHDGYCPSVTCNTNTCGSAFPFPPTRFPDPNAPVAPPGPYFQCSEARKFQITFCPSGGWPSDGSVPIHPMGNVNKCLDVRGAVFANGTPVQIYDCNGTGAQKWQIRSGSTKIKLAETNFCLDAGSSPANGIGMKIWQCYDNLIAQDWSYQSERYIRLGSTGQCLDLRNGDYLNSNIVQTWECNNANPNQLWFAQLN